MGKAEGDPKNRQRSKPKRGPNGAEVQNHKPERENQTKPGKSKRKKKTEIQKTSNQKLKHWGLNNTDLEIMTHNGKHLGDTATNEMTHS